MTNPRPDPKQTIKLIEHLKALGFDDEAFRLLHHFQGSMNSFERHARIVTSFHEDGNNHRVRNRLEFVLGSCTNGLPPKGEIFASLARESKRRIPPID
jgi:hypothetical protein